MIYRGFNFGEWNDIRLDGIVDNNGSFGTRNFGLICEWEPDKFQSLINEGNKLIKEKQYNKAIENYKKCIELTKELSPDKPHSIIDNNKIKIS